MKNPPSSPVLAVIPSGIIFLSLLIFASPCVLSKPDEETSEHREFHREKHQEWWKDLLHKLYKHEPEPYEEFEEIEKMETELKGLGKKQKE